MKGIHRLLVNVNPQWKMVKTESNHNFALYLAKRHILVAARPAKQWLRGAAIPISSTSAGRRCASHNNATTTRTTKCPSASVCPVRPVRNPPINKRLDGWEWTRPTARNHNAPFRVIRDSSDDSVTVRTWGRGFFKATSDRLARNLYERGMGRFLWKSTAISTIYLSVRAE